MTAVGLIGYSATAGTRGNNLPPKTFNAKPGVVNQPATSKPEIDTFTRTLPGDKSKKIAIIWIFSIKKFIFIKKIIVMIM